jgi:BrnA antitoxin of type II toxin-antitoxin system
MREKPASGKTRITIRLDDDILRWFRTQVRSSGGSYQTLINLSLRDHIAREPLEATLRRVVREELARASGRSAPHSYDYEEAPAALVADAADDGTAYGASTSRRKSPLRRGRRQS